VKFESATLHQRLERQWWRLMAAIEPVDPTAGVARIRFRRVPPIAVLCVYRYANAAHVMEVCRQAGAGAVIRLWALDETHPDLASWTVGSGPGHRSPLLNALYAGLPSRFDGYVLLSDDDYCFTRGGLRTFVAVAAAAGFGLAQPAHNRMSRISHWVTAGRRLTIARATTFVEVGPLVAVSPAWRHRVLPLADDGMGWGLDLMWSDLRQEGCGLGVVDACLINHLHTVVGSAGYDVDAERPRMEPFYEERGGYHTALRTLSTWWPWRRATAIARGRG
jgi:hypothetical protein